MNAMYAELFFLFLIAKVIKNEVRLKIKCIIIVAEMTFEKSQKYREFETLNYNINIPPDYDDRDFFAFKQASQRFHNKIGYLGRHPRRVK